MPKKEVKDASETESKIVSGIIAGLTLMFFGACATLFFRVTTLEANDKNKTTQMDRIEKKVDNVYSLLIKRRLKY